MGNGKFSKQNIAIWFKYGEDDDVVKDDSGDGNDYLETILTGFT